MKYCLAKINAVLGAFIVFFITACIGNAASAHNPDDRKTTIRVGIYAPFSNESAYIGRNMLGAMEIARDQMISPKLNYEFYTLDKMPNNSNSARILQKFIATHHINVLLTDATDSGALAAPLAKKNNMIHFCLNSDSALADGKNNFLARSPNHQQAAILTKNKTMNSEFIVQFKKEHFSQPVTEAGYAFDIFHLLNKSVVLAMKTNSEFSSHAIASHLLAIKSGTGVMGAYSLNKKGIFYKKDILTA